MATNKQKALAKEILQNPSMEMGQAMRKVGYSENTRPHDVTNTKEWKELVETLLPDEKLLLRHSEGLDATKIVTSHTEPDREVPDYAVRAKYIELGYRVKGRNEAPNVNVQVNNFIPLLGGETANAIQTNDSDK